MATYKTPGVSIEEIAKLPPSVAEVETAIPAFIGYTQQNNTGLPVNTPVRITSLLEYVALFGTAPVIPITVTVTETDGAITSITSTFSKPKYTMYYHMQLYFANGGGPCYIVSVGAANEASAVDDTKLAAGLTAVKSYDEPTLIVFPDGVNLADANKLYSLYKSALIQANDLKDRFVIMDCPGDNVANFRTGVGTDNLKYGAAYYPSLNTSLGYVYTEAQVTVKWTGSADTNLGALLTANNTRYNIVKQYVQNLSITLNPSAAIAGVYAAVDSTRGVWKAPANVSLSYVDSLTDQVSEEEQADLNVHTTGKSINAIRTITGKGHLVWGARTLAGNDNEWRYVSVRRFFNMVEESVKKATEAFVFEPNDANTWTKVQGMIENYLTTLWRAGALQGAKPEHAFYVSVGLGKTMTAQDILEGRMYVEIGMAAVRPAEFIILQFSHMMAQS